VNWTASSDSNTTTKKGSGVAKSSVLTWCGPTKHSLTCSGNWTISLTAIHTPGHSPGHVVYHFPEQNVLVGGDLIFVNSMGRTDLPDSDPNQMQESIRRVMKLPEQTRLLPGHGAVTTLADEAARNPYVIEAMSGG